MTFTHARLPRELNGLPRTEVRAAETSLQVDERPAF